MIEVVAFDGDDTLWHHERIFTDISARFRELLKHHVDGNILDEVLLATERSNLKFFGYGVKGFGLSLIETALDVCDGEITGAEVATMLDWIKEMLGDPVELLPGVEDTVEALRTTHRLGIVTKGDLFDQEGKIARSGLGERFDHVAIVSEKDETTYLRVFADWGVSPERVLMVGNSVRSDIEPVLAIGGQAVHVPYDITWQHEVVDAPQSDFPVFDDVRRVLGHVERLGRS